MGLITVTSPFLNELSYGTLPSADQAEIQALIEASSQLIEKFCGRNFAAADYVELHNGSGRDFLIVDNPPIISLDSIKFIYAGDDTDEIIQSTDFGYLTGSGEIRWLPFSQNSSKFNGGFFEGYQNIQITYRGGFETIPYPIQKACADLVKIMYDPAMHNAGLEKEKLGDYFYQMNVEKVGPLLSDNNKMLRLYKLYR